VFAPSESIASLIIERGVTSNIEILPTGIYVNKFLKGDGLKFRKKYGIKNNAFVVGTVSRIAPEKNIDFLIQVLIKFLKTREKAEFLVVGSGISLDLIKSKFNQENLEPRLHCTGSLIGQELIDAYHAMDVFAFASHSETQGLVIIEAMAAGIPVIAVNASGVREVVDNYVNGKLIEKDDEVRFCEGLEWFFTMPDETKQKVKEMAKTTAERFSVTHFVNKALDIYEQLINQKYVERSLIENPWLETIRLIKAEIKLAKTFTKATTAVLNGHNH
jgi:glycosyltransferase involved in cell wall biosynthesis